MTKVLSSLTASGVSFLSYRGLSFTIPPCTILRWMAKWEAVNSCLEDYLHCMAGELLLTWLYWLPLAEYWYNTNFHSSIQMMPFEALYGHPPPLHIPYFSKDSTMSKVDTMIRSREATVRILQRNIQKAQHQMKSLADRRCSDRVFQVGDSFFIKLHPYRQTYLRICIREILNSNLSILGHFLLLK